LLISVQLTELGKLITYIRGFASKIEAEKIKERTLRGKRAKAREGRIPGGSGTNIYGYDYIKVSQAHGGRRVINETEASWVKQAYQWLVDEGLSTNEITFRLRASNVPSKTGKIWARRSVQAILTNPAYTGKFYAFTTAKGRQQFTRPQEDWIEIKDVTPAIISQELFDAAQKQLHVNRTQTMPTTKHEYLLRGHLRCRQCGKSYVGGMTSFRLKKNGERYSNRGYRCLGKLRMYSPLVRCHNKAWSADKLEAMVWAGLATYLGDEGFIKGELQRQRQEAGHQSVFEAELERVERQLRAAEREQQQLLQWALKGFPESQVEAENKRINKAKDTLKAQKADLEAQLKASQNAVINIPKLEAFIRDIQDKLPTLDFEGKALALDMLNITVWLDGENIDATGAIEPEKQALRCTSNQDHYPLRGEEEVDFTLSA
jgi:site-specific DNA recombinase